MPGRCMSDVYSCGRSRSPRPSTLRTTVPATCHAAGDAGRHVFGHNGLERRVLDQLANRDRIAAAPHDATVGDRTSVRRDLQRSAARATSSSRAAAATRRSCAFMSASSGCRTCPCRTAFAAVSAMTSVIEAIGTCSSSATACVSDVRMFCPTSILPVKTVIVAGWRDVQPRVDVGRERLAASARAARLLPFETRRHEQHDEAAASVFRKSRRSNANRYRAASLSS